MTQKWADKLEEIYQNQLSLKDFFL
jgi:hypothetical protein